MPEGEKKIGGPVAIVGDHRPSPVAIRLTDLLNIGGGEGAIGQFAKKVKKN